MPIVQNPLSLPIEIRNTSPDVLQSSQLQSAPPPPQRDVADYTYKELRGIGNGLQSREKALGMLQEKISHVQDMINQRMSAMKHGVPKYADRETYRRAELATLQQRLQNDLTEYYQMRNNLGETVYGKAMRAAPKDYRTDLINAGNLPPGAPLPNQVNSIYDQSRQQVKQVYVKDQYGNQQLVRTEYNIAPVGQSGIKQTGGGSYGLPSSGNKGSTGTGAAASATVIPGQYVAGKGYVTETGKIYPTTNPNFRPTQPASGAGVSNSRAQSAGNVKTLGQVLDATVKTGVMSELGQTTQPEIAVTKILNGQSNSAILQALGPSQQPSNIMASFSQREFGGGGPTPGEDVMSRMSPDMSPNFESVTGEQFYAKGKEIYPDSRKLPIGYAGSLSEMEVRKSIPAQFDVIPYNPVDANRDQDMGTFLQWKYGPIVDLKYRETGNSFAGYTLPTSYGDKKASIIISPSAVEGNKAAEDGLLSHEFLHAASFTNPEPLILSQKARNQAQQMLGRYENVVEAPAYSLNKFLSTADKNEFREKAPVLYEELAYYIKTGTPMYKGPSLANNGIPPTGDARIGRAEMLPTASMPGYGPTQVAISNIIKGTSNLPSKTKEVVQASMLPTTPAIISALAGKKPAGTSTKQESPLLYSPVPKVTIAGPASFPASANLDVKQMFPVEKNTPAYFVDRVQQARDEYDIQQMGDTLYNEKIKEYQQLSQNEQNIAQKANQNILQYNQVQNTILKPLQETLTAQQMSLSKEAQTIDVSNPAAVAAFNKKQEAYTEKVNQYEKTRQESENFKQTQIEPLTFELSATQKNKVEALRQAYQVPFAIQKQLKAVENRDIINVKQENLDSALPEISELSWFKPYAGTQGVGISPKLDAYASYGLSKIGLGISKTGRGIADFLVVNPGRVIKKDVESGDVKRIIGDMAPANVLAKGVFNWQDPETYKRPLTTSFEGEAAMGGVNLAIIAATGGAGAGASGVELPAATGLRAFGGTALKYGVPALVAAGLVGGPAYSVYAGNKALASVKDQQVQLDKLKQNNQISDQEYQVSKDFLQKQYDIVNQQRTTPGEAVGQGLTGVGEFLPVVGGAGAIAGGVPIPKYFGGGRLGGTVPSSALIGEGKLTGEAAFKGESFTGEFGKFTTPKGVEVEAPPIPRISPVEQYKPAFNYEYTEKPGGLFAKGEIKTTMDVYPNRDIVRYREYKGKAYETVQRPGEQFSTTNIFSEQGKLLRTVKEKPIVLGNIGTPKVVARGQPQMITNQMSDSTIFQALKENQLVEGRFPINSGRGQFVFKGSEEPYMQKLSYAPPETIGMTKTPYGRTSIRGKLKPELPPEYASEIGFREVPLRIGNPQENMPGISTRTQFTNRQPGFSETGKPYIAGYTYETQTVARPAVRSEFQTYTPGEYSFSVENVPFKQRFSESPFMQDVRNLITERPYGVEYVDVGEARPVNKAMKQFMSDRRGEIGGRTPQYEFTGGKPKVRGRQPRQSLKQLGSELQPQEFRPAFVEQLKFTESKPAFLSPGFKPDVDLKVGALIGRYGAARLASVGANQQIRSLIGTSAASESLLGLSQATGPATAQVPKVKLSQSLTPVQVLTPESASDNASTAETIAGISQLGAGAFGVGGLVPQFGLPRASLTYGGLTGGNQGMRRNRGLNSWIITNRVAMYGEQFFARQKATDFSQIIGRNRVVPAAPQYPGRQRAQAAVERGFGAARGMNFAKAFGVNKFR